MARFQRKAALKAFSIFTASPMACYISSFAYYYLHCLESRTRDLGLRIVLDIGRPFNRSKVAACHPYDVAWLLQGYKFQCSTNKRNLAKRFLSESGSSGVGYSAGQAIVYCAFPRRTANWDYLSWETGTHSASSQLEE